MTVYQYAFVSIGIGLDLGLGSHYRGFVFRIVVQGQLENGLKKSRDTRL